MTGFPSWKRFGFPVDKSLITGPRTTSFLLLKFNAVLSVLGLLRAEIPATAPATPRYYLPNGNLVSIGARLHQHQDGTIMTEHSMGPNDNSVVVTTVPPNGSRNRTNGMSQTRGRRTRNRGAQTQTRTQQQNNMNRNRRTTTTQRTSTQRNQTQRTQTQRRTGGMGGGRGGRSGY